VTNPPEQARVLALGGRVQLDEPEVELDIGHSREHGLDRIAAVLPYPEQLIVQLDRAENTLVCGEALGEPSRERRVVIVARPRLGRLNRVFEGVVHECDEAQVAP